MARFFSDARCSLCLSWIVMEVITKALCWCSNCDGRWTFAVLKPPRWHQLNFFFVDLLHYFPMSITQILLVNILMWTILTYELLMLSLNSQRYLLECHRENLSHYKTIISCRSAICITLMKLSVMDDFWKYHLKLFFHLSEIWKMLFITCPQKADKTFENWV